MRKTLGVLVLVAGVAGLGWYGARNNAVRMEKHIETNAQSIVSSSIHGLSTVVKGRDIELNGIADTVQERDGFLSSLNDIKGRRVVRDNTSILPKASPFEFSAVKGESGMSYAGVVPSEKDRALLAGKIGSAADALTMSSGAPEGWTGVVVDKLDVLDKLENGTLSISDRKVRLTGLARTPKESDAALALLSGLPAGYTLDSEFEYLDDGTPPRFDVTYSAASGATVSGKVPAGLTQEKIASALGLKDVSGEPVVALDGAPDADVEILGKISSWLPEVDEMNIRSDAASYTVQAAVAPGGDLELIEAGLKDNLGSGAKVSVTDLSSLPAEGAKRVNTITGLGEVFSGGYWLPSLDFVAGQPSCDEQGKNALTANKVHFLSGSARVDARAARSLNAIASVVLKCVREANLKVEVGGHTDSQGSDELNLDLSAKRAEAVRNALLERGVPDGSITSQGYGETQPVADNNTEEGRAANRRTTLIFSQ